MGGGGGREYVCTPCLFRMWGEGSTFAPLPIQHVGGGSTFAPPVYSACGGREYVCTPCLFSLWGEGVRLHPLPIRPVGGGSTFAPPAYAAAKMKSVVWGCLSFRERKIPFDKKTILNNKTRPSGLKNASYCCC